jgi:hypothetical protein
MKDVTPTRTHYEAGFSDSFQHRRCFHKHRTLEAAVKCAMPYGLYGYVFAVEGGVGRELKETEKRVVRAIRFGKKLTASGSTAGAWVSSEAVATT